MYFLIKRLSSNEYFGAVLSAHKRSVAFLDTKEQFRESCYSTRSNLECSWVPTSAQEPSLCHGTMLKSAYDWSLLPMSTQGCSWPLISAHESSWHLDHECSWLFWAIMSTNEYSSVLLSTIENGANTRWALVSIREHSWALISTQECSWCHGNFLLTAP